jgi:hypothetical protein
LNLANGANEFWFSNSSLKASFKALRDTIHYIYLLQHLEVNVEAILNTPNGDQILEKWKELNQNISARLPSEFHKICFPQNNIT